MAAMTDASRRWQLAHRDLLNERRRAARAAETPEQTAARLIAARGFPSRIKARRKAAKPRSLSPETQERQRVAKRRWNVEHQERQRAQRAAAALEPPAQQPETGVVFVEHPRSAPAQKAKPARVVTEAQEVQSRRQYQNALEFEQAIRRVVLKALAEDTLGVTSPWLGMSVAEAMAEPFQPRDGHGRLLPVPAIQAA